jgi:prolyl-tRNA synthetase
VIQLPSTHLLGTNFSKPFDVRFMDRDEKQKYGHITCYGPAISRIYGAMIAILGDDQGLVLPFDLAPVQIVIVPIIFDKVKDEIIRECKKVQKELEKKYSVRFDDRDYVSAGEKFNEWELKGVPIRIEIGPKDLEKSQAKVVTRHNSKKEFVPFEKLDNHINEIAKNYTKEIKEKTHVDFSSMIHAAKDIEDAKKAIENGKIVSCGFCSIELDGAKCAEKVEKELGAFVRGKRVDKETTKFEKCLICGKPAKETVYIARSY